MLNYDELRLDESGLDRQDLPRWITMRQDEIRHDLTAMIDNYVYSRKLRPHQEAEFFASRDAPLRALFHEQRTGKSAIIVNTACYLHQQNKINAVLVVAPASVHRTWAEDHFPDDASPAVRWSAVDWDANRATGEKGLVQERSKWFTFKTDLLLNFDGLAVLTTGREALLTDNLRKYLAKFLRHRKSMLVVDESDDGYGSPTNQSYKTVMRAREWCPYRRILTGTPAPEGNPIDLWTQLNILDWRVHGYQTLTAFRARYQETKYVPLGRPRQVMKTAKDGHKFKGIQTKRPEYGNYINLDELRTNVDKVASRVTRAQVSGAPDKTYSKRYFQLTERQRQVYENMREQFRVELRGRTLTAADVLPRLLRLHQITCNWLPFGDIKHCPACGGRGLECEHCSGLGVEVTESYELVDPRHNPRLETLQHELQRDSGPSVIWCRFQNDCRLVAETLGRMGRQAARLDGGIEQVERHRGYLSFREGHVDWAVSTPGAGGRGLSLKRGATAYYYSNDWPLKHRLQSEDRTEDLGKTIGTAVVDIIAEGTVDERIVKVLRAKRSLAEVVQGDPHQEWI